MGNLRDTVRARFFGVYTIVDDQVHSEYGLERLMLQIVEHSTIPVLQLRCKFSSRLQIVSLIDFSVGLKSRRDFILIINDHAEFLSLPGVDGVHIGQGDGDVAKLRARFPQKIIGVSAHSVTEGCRAERAGADYLGCGCVFPTGTKSNVVPLGLAGLSDILAVSTLPVVAIGGICNTNINKVKRTGVAMAALASGLISDARFVGQELAVLWQAP